MQSKFLAIFILLSIGCSSMNTEFARPQLERLEVASIDGYPLDDSFKLSLHLQVSPANRTTMPRPLQVVLLCDNEVECTVRRMSDLADYVKITDSDSALAFVRLLTDCRIRSDELEEWEGWELDNDGAVIGLKGVVPTEIFIKSGWHPPVVERSGDGFVIRRLIIRWVWSAASKQSSDEIVEATEQVHDDGSYEKTCEVVKFKGTFDVGQHRFEL